MEAGDRGVGSNPDPAGEGRAGAGAQEAGEGGADRDSAKVGGSQWRNRRVRIADRLIVTGCALRVLRRQAALGGPPCAANHRTTLTCWSVTPGKYSRNLSIVT